MSVVIDVSEHGDVVCNVPYSNEYKRSNFYKQLEEVEKSVSENGYDENTIVVVDGGTNDLLKYYSENVQGKDTHFNLTLWENNGSDHDLESSLRNFLDTTVHMYGNDDSTQSYQVPIFFLMPLTRNQVTGNDLNSKKYSYSIIGRERIKSIVEEYADRGVVIIDPVMDAREDMFYDNIHYNKNGYDMLMGLYTSKYIEFLKGRISIAG